jgi:hypothetical protein
MLLFIAFYAEFVQTAVIARLAKGTEQPVHLPACTAKPAAQPAKLLEPTSLRQ